MSIEFFIEISCIYIIMIKEIYEEQKMLREYYDY